MGKKDASTDGEHVNLCRSREAKDESDDLHVLGVSRVDRKHVNHSLKYGRCTVALSVKGTVGRGQAHTAVRDPSVEANLM